MSLFTRHAPAPTETAILDDAPAQDEHGTHTLHHNGDSPTPTFEALGVSHDLTETLTKAGIDAAPSRSRRWPSPMRWPARTSAGWRKPAPGRRSPSACR